jgi:hypothetical protein
MNASDFSLPIWVECHADWYPLSTEPMAPAFGNVRAGIPSAPYCAGFVRETTSGSL